MTSTVSTHMNNTSPEIAWNHRKATQAVREGCIKLEELVLNTKPVLGGRQAQARAEEECVYTWMTKAK